MTKKAILIILSAGIVAGGILYFCQKRNFGGDIPEHLQLKVPENRILSSRETDWIAKDEYGVSENKGRMMIYSYISEVEVPAEKGEDISRRTKNAKFFKKEDLGEGLEKWEAKFYAGTPFYREDDKWYQTETATTSLEAWEEQTISFFEKLINKALATNFYSTGGDGAVDSDSSNWDLAHDDEEGAEATWEATSDYFAGVGAYGVDAYVMYRGFMPMDTSDLPDSPVISSATLKLYITTLDYDDNDAQAYVAIVQTTQASTTALETFDIDNCGLVDDPPKGSADIDLDGLSINQYNDIAMNATGMGWINDAGVTKIGIREGHDIEDDPVTESAGNNRIIGRQSEYEGTDYDPYLVIEYTAGTGEERHIRNPIMFK